MGRDIILEIVSQLPIKNSSSGFMRRLSPKANKYANASISTLNFQYQHDQNASCLDAT